MNLTFIETAMFSKFRAEHISDETFRALQNELLNNPEKGDIVKGLNGVRKIRIADIHRNKGKRGGIRAMYFIIQLESGFIFYLLTVKMKWKI